MSMAISVSDISPSAALRIAMHTAICLEEIAAAKATPAWQRDAENELTVRLQGILDDVSQAMVQELIRLGYIPKGDDLTLAALMQWLTGATDDVADAIEPAVQTSAVHGRAVVTTSQLTFDAFSEQARNQLHDHVFEASERTIERVRGHVMANLTQSYEDGVGIQEAARRLREVFDGMTESELRRVARTEIISAQNYGTHATEIELGIEYHQWLTARDSRVRDSHEDLQGVIVRVGDKFPNGLVHPGDRNGDIEEWINCRCRVRPYLMPEGKAAPAEQWFTVNDLIDIVQEAA